MHVKKIAEVDDQRHTITLEMVLAAWWYDSRIRLESNDPNK